MDGSSNWTDSELVQHLLAALNAGGNEDAIVAELVASGMSSAAAHKAVDVVRAALTRAAFLAGGMQPEQFVSDFDQDALFVAALKQARARLSSVAAGSLDKQELVSAESALQDVEQRRTRMYQLGEAKDSEAIGELIAALDDRDRDVRMYAIQSLKSLKARPAVACLCRLLAEDQDGMILSNVISSLEGIGDREAVPQLICATRHADPFVRHDVARVLGELGDPAAIPALEALLSDTTVPLEVDEQQLTTRTSIYRVCDQAERSLKKLRSWPGKTGGPWWKFWP